MGRILHVCLVGFAALVGLFDGPAQIACVLALIACFGAGRFARYRPGYVELGLLLWALAGVPALVLGSPSGGTEGMLRPLLSLAFFVGCIGLADPDDVTLRRMATAFAGACVINGLYGYVQVFIADPPLEALIVGRARSEHLIDPENPERLRMATGLFYNRLKLAHVGIVALGLLGLLAAEPSSRRRWSVIGALVLAGALFLTFRRAAPLALIIAGGWTAVVAGRSRVALSTLAAGVAVVTLFVMTDYGWERVAGLSENVVERRSIYDRAMLVIREHPWWGVGHGQYKQAILQATPNMARDLTTSPHNLVLHVLAETGIVGLLGFCIGVGGAYGRLVARVRRSDESIASRRQRDLFALLGLTCTLILGVAHSVLYHAPVALLFWTLVGVAAIPRSARAPAP